jgi:flavin reductase (DIM6/NTAB) family NADH-FMN oxidoreductase RutF
MHPNLSDQFRFSMRHWATGITIVSTQQDGIFHGMTVSSFTSVSLEPPTVTISLMKNSRTHDMVIETDIFGITLLSSDQQALSVRFAGQSTEDLNRFDGVEIQTLVSGAPFLMGGLAYIDCKLVAVHSFDQNSLFIGEVLAAEAGSTGRPLLYYDQQYRMLQD